MFGLFGKGKKEVILYAPVDGECIPLEQVPDQIFAKKMIGDGIAFRFSGDQVCAPCDGEIVMIADSLHAFGMKASNGAEILIHIGMDTVNLEGRGFEKLVDVRTKVKAGDPVIRLDRKALAEAGVDLTTPMILSNGGEFEYEILESGGSVQCKDTPVIRFQ